MGEGKVASNGIQIWYEDFGDSNNPTVLFIAGSSGQATRWPLELINPIVEAGYHVIRFDNRDVGFSTWIDTDGADRFTVEDMADDAVGLLDALNVDKAHIIGASLGGEIAQYMAIKYPERVLTLTSWMATYFYDDPDVPAMNEEFAAWFLSHTSENYPQGRESIIEVNVEAFKRMAGSGFPVDEKLQRDEEEREYDRAYNPKLYQALDMETPRHRLDDLRKLDVPTLVIHGDEDPMVSYIHGIIVAKVIRGAKLYTQKGVGHGLPPETIPETVTVILEHIGK